MLRHRRRGLQLVHLAVEPGRVLLFCEVEPGDAVLSTANKASDAGEGAVKGLGAGRPRSYEPPQARTRTHVHLKRVQEGHRGGVVAVLVQLVLECNLQVLSRISSESSAQVCETMNGAPSYAVGRMNDSIAPRVRSYTHGKGPQPDEGSVERSILHEPNSSEYARFSPFT